MSLKWVPLQDIVLVTGQGLHSTSGETSMVFHCNVCSVVWWCTKLNMPRPPKSHHISEVGGFWEGRSTCFCVDNSFPLPLASDGDGLHKSTDFFWAVVVSVMSHDCTGLCPVPRTDNKAPHWSSHTDAASCFASFERWTSWKNVKHPGNPRKALLARQRSNKCADLRGCSRATSCFGII